MRGTVFVFAGLLATAGAQAAESQQATLSADALGAIYERCVQSGGKAPGAEAYCSCWRDRLAQGWTREEAEKIGLSEGAGTMPPGLLGRTLSIVQDCSSRMH